MAVWCFNHFRLAEAATNHSCLQCQRGCLQNSGPINILQGFWLGTKNTTGGFKERENANCCTFLTTAPSSHFINTADAKYAESLHKRRRGLERLPVFSTLGKQVKKVTDTGFSHKCKKKKKILSVAKNSPSGKMISWSNCGLAGNKLCVGKLRRNISLFCK